MIDEIEYRNLKEKIREDHNYLIDLNNGAFSALFKTEIIILCISIVTMVIVFSLGEEVAIWIGGFSMVIFLGTSIRVMFVGLKRARKINEKKEQAKKITGAIRHSENYEGFKFLMKS